MPKKNLTQFSLLIALIFFISGCAGLQKKFVRKKKTEEHPAKGFVRVRAYNVKPSLDLYQKHYIYWKNWQRELEIVFGKNKKKTIRCAEEILSNLMDMQGLLVDAKAGELQRHIDIYKKILSTLKQGADTMGNKVRIRRSIEAETRAIKRGFSYTKMGPFIRKDFK